MWCSVGGAARRRHLLSRLKERVPPHFLPRMQWRRCGRRKAATRILRKGGPRHQSSKTTLTVTKTAPMSGAATRTARASSTPTTTATCASAFFAAATTSFRARYRRIRWRWRCCDASGCDGRACSVSVSGWQVWGSGAGSLQVLCEVTGHARGAAPPDLLAVARWDGAAHHFRWRLHARSVERRCHII